MGGNQGIGVNQSRYYSTIVVKDYFAGRPQLFWIRWIFPIYGNFYTPLRVGVDLKSTELDLTSTRPQLNLVLSWTENLVQLDLDLTSTRPRLIIRKYMVLLLRTR